MTLVPKFLSLKMWSQHKYYWDKEKSLTLEAHKARLLGMVISVISQ